MKPNLPFLKFKGINTEKQENGWRTVKKKGGIPKDTHGGLKNQINAIRRECSKCKAIIESKVLEQCPICFSELPPLPELQKKKLYERLNNGKKQFSWKPGKLGSRSKK